MERPAERYTILPGRFQPPHNDHVTLVRQVTRQLHEAGQGPLYLGLIVHAPALRPQLDPSPSWAEFDAEAREQNQPERTPFTFAQRLLMWQKIFAESSFIHCPAIVALPRPESAWDWIAALFPGQRTWVVPECGERFDDMKAHFFRKRGDRVVRPALPATTDGRLVRAVLDQPNTLKEHVPPYVAAHIATLCNS